MGFWSSIKTLPRELRDIIWENTLPPPRLITLDRLCRVHFDHFNDSVQRVYQLWFRDQQVSELQRVEPSDMTHCFDFRERYPPPVINQICRESRQVALRAGYFPLPAWSGSDKDAFGERPGAAWFNMAADTLYIEGSSVPSFLTTAPFRIPNAVRVRSVGVAWKHMQGGAKTSPPVWDSQSSRVSFRRRLLAPVRVCTGLNDPAPCSAGCPVWM